MPTASVGAPPWAVGYSPLAGPVSQADDAARTALMVEAGNALAEYARNGDLTFPIAAHLLSAGRHELEARAVLGGGAAHFAGCAPVRDMMLFSPTSFAIWVISSGVTTKPQLVITCAACSAVVPISPAELFIAK